MSSARALIQPYPRIAVPHVAVLPAFGPGIERATGSPPRVVTGAPAGACP